MKIDGTARRVQEVIAGEEQFVDVLRRLEKGRATGNALELFSCVSG